MTEQLALDNAIVFEIQSPVHYDLAVAMSPHLAEITYEALKGHYFVISDCGALTHATFPPGLLPAEDLKLMPDEFGKIDLLRVTK